MRSISIDYNLQVPVCIKCHMGAHRLKKRYQHKFEHILGIDHTKAMIDMRKKHKTYLLTVSAVCAKIIESYAV